MFLFQIQTLFHLQEIYILQREQAKYGNSTVVFELIAQTLQRGELSNDKVFKGESPSTNVLWHNASNSYIKYLSLIGEEFSRNVNIVYICQQACSAKVSGHWSTLPAAASGSAGLETMLPRASRMDRPKPSKNHRLDSAANSWTNS